MQGSVIVVDGTSGAGKSSVIKQLMPMLDSSYQYVAVDDFVTEVYLEYQKLNLSEQELLERITQRCDVMHEKIGALVARGIIVVLETVLSGLEGEKSVKRTLEKLKNPPVFMVLVYCPLPILIERIKQSSKRSIATAISQFGHIYHEKIMAHEIPCGILSRYDVEQACEASKKEFGQNTKQFEQFQEWVLSQLGVKDREEAQFTTQLTYDCIIDTSKQSPFECAQTICKALKR